MERSKRAAWFERYEWDGRNQLNHALRHRRFKISGQMGTGKKTLLKVGRKRGFSYRSVTWIGLTIILAIPPSASLTQFLLFGFAPNLVDLTRWTPSKKGREILIDALEGSSTRELRLAGGRHAAFWERLRRRHEGRAGPRAGVARRQGHRGGRPRRRPRARRPLREGPGHRPADHPAPSALRQPRDEKMLFARF